MRSIPFAQALEVIWFLDAFYPEVHKEFTKTWKVAFLGRTCFAGSSILSTLDGGAAQGYVDVPQVECVIALHLFL